MRLSCVPLIFLILILQAAVSGKACAGGACNHWLTGPLHNQPAGISNAGVISASAIWTPATGGSFLVVGGSFVTAGGVTVNNIAAWDGASWRALGSETPGTNGSVLALAVFNGDLIACGAFSQAGGAPATNIARFNGTVWQPLTGPLGEGVFDTVPNFLPHARALAVFNNELIVGGHFLKAGGVTVTNIAKWNGAGWSPINAMPPEIGGIGTPSQGLANVSAMRVHADGKLYIGGNFGQAGGLTANAIVGFANGSYFTMGSGVGSGAVMAVNSFGIELIVAGNFSQAGGLSAINVARFNTSTSTWAAMSSGLGNTSGLLPLSLQPFNGQLVAGGTFNGGVSTWNGSTWSTVGGGVSGGVPPQQARVFTLNVFDGKLVAAGNFTTAGGNAIQHIAQWNLSFWSALQAPTPQVFAFETLGSRFVAAGSFLQSTTNQTPANNIIGWTGTTLTRVQNNLCCGEGTNGTIRALKSFTAVGTPHLIVGGDFTVAGGLAANRIAQYDQPQLAGAAWITLGAGFNNSVLAIERFNNATYAGGSFTQSGGTGLNRIARFDGTNWVALGTGVNGPVNAMKVYNGALYVGGSFTTAGGLNTGGLARWSGTQWSIAGFNLPGTVLALEVHDNELVIGGSFTGVTGSNVVRWNGTSFVSLNPGNAGTNAAVNALKSDGAYLYLIGEFTSAGGVTVNKVARWNSTDGWSNVDGGTNDVVNTLGLYRGEIQVGLGISLGLDDSDSGDEPESAAPQPGNGWVRYSPTATAWVASQPISQTISCNQSATFSAQPAQGYFLLLASWLKNGVALNDGPTGHGSTISGVHAGTLTITGARTFDAGSYTCVFANLCGAATSSAATLTVNNCCNPDIDGNHFVNVDDLLAVINQWGPCPTPPASCLADIAPAGGNGFVNVDDMLMVINGWGPCP